MKWLVPVAMLALSGCGASNDDGGPADALDCAWLAREDNCWRTTVNSIRACTPPAFAEADGTFNAGRTECSYESGHKITFKDGLQLPMGEFSNWDLTITSGGATCAHFVEKETDSGDSSMELTGPNGTVHLEANWAGYSISCPDGKRYATNNPLGLLECGMSMLPGTARSTFDNSASLQLIGLGSADSVELFLCNDPIPL
ncbi:hypothetical protein AKJ08_1525 [Vulgatibacter incomptus]|uniref:Lipoprotein n=2 Tax=Vulgatibacter incomptus TaxID=1391653 RepID=A0A0K1PC73_9BACT|nr:hypothetical protein AKJ08_1525 [Vulgatibacter incomptus]